MDPTDICEDPELKNRIAALRTEQEIRARADHQKNRRPQSTAANTRTHSIRRNSTRDKGLTSKKQIKNEAIIGIQIVRTRFVLACISRPHNEDAPIAVNFQNRSHVNETFRCSGSQQISFSVCYPDVKASLPLMGSCDGFYFRR